MASLHKKYEVIIVGGGPTGVALGLELGLAGISDRAKLDSIIQLQEDWLHHGIALEQLNVAPHTYPYRYLLIRPDWHIAFAGDDLPGLLFNDQFLKLFISP